MPACPWLAAATLKGGTSTQQGVQPYLDVKEVVLVQVEGNVVVAVVGEVCQEGEGVQQLLALTTHLGPQEAQVMAQLHRTVVPVLTPSCGPREGRQHHRPDQVVMHRHQGTNNCLGHRPLWSQGS